MGLPAADRADETKQTSSQHILLPSMRSAHQALELEHLCVVCHGDGQVAPLAEGISAVPLQSLAKNPIPALFQSMERPIWRDAVRPY